VVRARRVDARDDGRADGAQRGAREAVSCCMNLFCRCKR
jgi:hypothetical protein